MQVYILRGSEPLRTPLVSTLVPLKNLNYQVELLSFN